MIGKLHNTAAIYLVKDDKALLLFRQGGQVVTDVWTGSAGGHFEDFEINNAISSVGWMQYKISNIPFYLVFQWDDLFGIVIINNNQTEKEDVLHFLKNYGGSRLTIAI